MKTVPKNLKIPDTSLIDQLHNGLLLYLTNPEATPLALPILPQGPTQQGQKPTFVCILCFQVTFNFRKALAHGLQERASFDEDPVKEATFIAAILNAPPDELPLWEIVKIFRAYDVDKLNALFEKYGIQG